MFTRTERRGACHQHTMQGGGYQHFKYLEHYKALNVAISAGDSLRTPFVAHILELRLTKEPVHRVSGCQAPGQRETAISEILH